MSLIKVLLIGVGSKPSTFLLRRMHALARNRIYCIVIGKRYNEKMHLFKFFKEYDITSIKDILVTFFIFLISPIKWASLFRILNISPQLSSAKKLALYYRYLNILDSKINLIHVQWITQVPEIAWMKKHFKTPIIASVRGSMSTIYPFKYDNYDEKLREAFKLADRLHFVSKGLMNFCQYRFQLDPAKCFVNYNGIDPEKFKPLEDKQKSIMRHKIKLISVGALIWRKNFQDLLKIVNQSRFLEKIELSIIGEGEELYILNYMINKFQLQGHVNLLGHLPEIEIINHLQHADLYLSTSYAEGLSNAVMEAASCGLPVIAFECEGMDEIIRPDVSGIIIPNGRTDLFVQRLDQLIGNKKLRKDMGIAAREHVVENFDENKHVVSMITEYKNLIDHFNKSYKKTY